MHRPKTKISFVLDDERTPQFFITIEIEDSGWSNDGQLALIEKFQHAINQVYPGFRVRLDQFIDPDRTTGDT